MGLGSVLKKFDKKKEGKYLLPYLDKAIKQSGAKFSWGNLRKTLELLEESVEEKSLIKLFKAFNKLNEYVYADQNRSKEFIHASEILNACPRKLFYDLTGMEYSNPEAGTPSAQLQFIFDFGTWIHSYIQLNLAKAGILEDMEVSVFDPLNKIGGRADGIVKVLERRVLEIKSCNSRKFASLKVAPDSDHVTQASIYAKQLGLEELHFLYINKDTCDVKEFVVPADLLAVSRIELIAQEVLVAVEAKKAPDRVCLNDISAKALVCKYSSVCFKS